MTSCCFVDVTRKKQLKQLMMTNCKERDFIPNFVQEERNEKCKNVALAMQQYGPKKRIRTLLLLKQLLGTRCIE